MILSRDQMIERALRKIGAWAISQRSPRRNEVDEAAYWLDMAVGHQAARGRTWWLIPETKTFDLVADQADYDLTTAIGVNNLRNGIEFIVSAWLYDVAMGEDIHELSIIRRLEYEAIERKAEPGVPCRLYIDRQQAPKAWVHPVPTDARAYQVRLVIQTYSDDFKNAKPTSKAFHLRSSWNLWTVTELAYQCGNGPVRKLPADEVKECRTEALRLRNELESFEHEEKHDLPRQVEYYNGI